MLLTLPPLLRSIAYRNALDSVRPALLDRLLKHFGDAASDSSTALPRFRELLDQLDVLMELRHDLPADVEAIVELASKDGRGLLLHAARIAGEPASLATDFSPSELAVKLFLDHRGLFDDARLQLASVAAHRFTDFRGRSTIADPSGDPETFGDTLGKWLTRPDAHETWTVHGLATPTEICFNISRWRTAARPRVEQVADVAQCQHQDCVVFDKTTGVLSIEARSVLEMDVYRQEAGNALFGDPDYFRAEALYTAEPLAALGLEALSVDGVRGLTQVVLQAFTVVLDDEARVACRFSGSDLAAMLASPYGRVALERGTVRHVKLSLGLSQRPTPLTLEICPPNQLVFDRRVDVRAVRRFLELRGFLCAEPRS